jgi:hypothetical protein
MSKQGSSGNVLFFSFILDEKAEARINREKSKKTKIKAKALKIKVFYV